MHPQTWSLAGELEQQDTALCLEASYSKQDVLLYSQSLIFKIEIDMISEKSLYSVSDLPRSGREYTDTVKDVLSFTIKSSTFDQSTEFWRLDVLDAFTDLSQLVIIKSYNAVCCWHRAVP